MGQPHDADCSSAPADGGKYIVTAPIRREEGKAELNDEVSPSRRASGAWEPDPKNKAQLTGKTYQRL